MGLTSSPYQCVQAMAFAEEVIRGDRRDTNNIYHWSTVRMNLPGSPNYKPGLTWVSKIRGTDGKLACDLFIYVDDLRPTGNSKLESWRAGRRAASISNHLGIQDASRKRRDGKQASGAWAGAIIKTGPEGVFVLVAKDKWVKMQKYLLEVQQMIVQQPQQMDRKRLEVIRGFLNYIAQTYRCMASYLIGFHMTIDGWRRGRDGEGWRIGGSQAAYFGNQDEGYLTDVEPERAPKTVAAVPRLKHDVEALQSLCSDEEPTLKRVRVRRTGRVYYGFGDASKAGFGATIEIDGEIHYTYGQWSTEASESMSSNWRELCNLVDSLEAICMEHEVSGCEIFIFTDNSTAESAYWKGTSTSRHLFDLILRLKKLEMEHDLLLHVVHVSGRRMIIQGTDGISRGDHSEGVMRGVSMAKFIPIHLSVFDREPKLKTKFQWSMGSLKHTILTPEGWFDAGHQESPGNYIWAPAPAAADVVMEEVGRSRLKRPQCFHIVVVPRLMTGRWRRLMGRATDFYFVLNWEDSWPLSTNFEPLLVFICLPYRSHSPNFPARRKILDTLRRTMLQDQVPPIPEKRKWDILRKLWCEARSLCPL